MYMLFLTVPESHLEAVKKAIFAAGAGKADHYSDCCWQTLGQAQFMPLAGSNPFIGKINELKKVAEYQVTTMCAAADLKKIITALKDAHPYEVPSYQVFKLENY
jgi:structural toxin protein (hemagglutinin/hemolysin) RtxA